MAGTHGEEIPSFFCTRCPVKIILDHELLVEAITLAYSWGKHEEVDGDGQGGQKGVQPTPKFQLQGGDLPQSSSRRTHTLGEGARPEAAVLPNPSPVWPAVPWTSSCLPTSDRKEDRVGMEDCDIVTSHHKTKPSQDDVLHGDIQLRARKDALSLPMLREGLPLAAS
ncbi:hypothetical protein Q9966_008271 [Columba livia]|nr:hypothetical protein Q9966_008271 [Columba livia]